MEVGKLNVQLRSGTGKGSSRSLRRQGLVPGTCYGAGLESPLNITVAPKELRASLDPTKGENTVINLTVQDNGAAKAQLTAMVGDFQMDPIRAEVIHIDLIAIDPEKLVEVDVPIETTGKAPGTVDGGQVYTIRHDVPVRCKPADIPAKFVIDIGGLHIGEVLHASDIPATPGVTVLLEDSVGLITCTAPAAEKEVAEAAEGEAPAEGEAAAKPAEGDKEKKEG